MKIIVLFNTNDSNFISAVRSAEAAGAPAIVNCGYSISASDTNTLAIASGSANQAATPTAAPIVTILDEGVSAESK